VLSWDRTLPTGSTAVASSDNVIRSNWDYLRDAIRQEHGDPDAFPSTAAQIVHLQGSARAIIYTGATILDSSADVVAAVTLYHDSRDIGRIVFDKNTTGTPGAAWYCTAIDVFVELTRIWSNVVIAGTAGITGLVTASGGVTIPTTKLLTGPTGESWLVNGAQQMNPLLHAARHLMGGQDVLTGILAGNVVYKTAAGPFTAPGVMNTITFDYSGRAGNTLLAVMAWATLFNLNINHNLQATMSIQSNTVDKSQDLIISRNDPNVPYRNSPGSVFSAFTVTNLTARVIDFKLKVTEEDGAAVNFTNGQILRTGMIILDCGAVGLTP